MLQMNQHYEPEFKKKIVRLHLEEGRSLKGLAAEYGVSKASISNWTKQFREECQINEEAQADYDEYENLTKYIQQQIKWLDANHIRVWWFNNQTGTRELRGDFKVYTNKYGLKCFHAGNQDEDFVTGKMSLYFLKNFKKHVA